jgi:cyclase
MFSELAPGVFSVDHRVVEGKNGIILGGRSALAIDSGSEPEEGLAMAEFIRARGYAPNRLALTHGHGDHLLGGAAFADAEVFAHARAPEVIRRQIPAWADRAGMSAEAMEARLLHPTITFAGDLRIDLGGKRVRFLHTPGHSDDGVSLYVEEDRLLFAGDTVVTGIVPAIGDGDSRVLQASLNALASLEIDVLVPGHGPVLFGQEAVRECLAWLQEYLERIRTFVSEELRRGSDPETVADAAEYARFVGDRFLPDRHGMLRRHRNTVAKILEEGRR